MQVFPPPPVRGVGRAGGFMIMIEDRGDIGPQVLQEETENLARKRSMRTDRARRCMGVVLRVFRANVPQLSHRARSARSA